MLKKLFAVELVGGLFMLGWLQYSWLDWVKTSKKPATRLKTRQERERKK